jgi:tyrosinase
MSAANLSYDAVAAVLQTPDIHAFRPLLEMKMHPSAHSFVGGDLCDLFSSPNDPVVFLLHAQIDWLWSLWQAQDLKARGTALDGTQTFLNMPPSQNATLDTAMKMGITGSDIPVKGAISATGGQFCDVYV